MLAIIIQTVVIVFLCAASAFADDIERITTFQRGAGGYHTYRIPSAIVTRDGTLLAFCEGRVNSGSDSGEIHLLVKRSSDNGKSFSQQQIVWSDGKNTCGNPCPVVDQSTGTIWLLMTHNLGQDVERDIVHNNAKQRTVWVTSSSDDGKTWAKPREITADVSKPEWAWYATGPGVGIQLQRGKRAGRLVIPCDYTERASAPPLPVLRERPGEGSKRDVSDGPIDAVSAAPSPQPSPGVPGEGERGAGAGKPAGNSHVFYSDDHGATWKLGGEAPERRFNESQIVELSDGRLMLNMRNTRPPKLPQRGVCISDDGGETFKDLRHDPALIEPVCQASIIAVPGERNATAEARRDAEERRPADADKKEQPSPRSSAPLRDSALQFLLFSNPASESKRVNMTVRMSRDDGQTWTVSKVIHEGPTAYSCLVALPDGMIGLLYERGDESPYEQIEFARFRMP